MKFKDIFLFTDFEKDKEKLKQKIAKKIAILKKAFTRLELRETISSSADFWNRAPVEITELEKILEDFPKTEKKLTNLDPKKFKRIAFKKKKKK